MEMAEEWRACAGDADAEKARREELLTLAKDIVAHNVKHNAEVEACDLLFEIERLDLLVDYVEEVDHARVCLYLLRCSTSCIGFLSDSLERFNAVQRTSPFIGNSLFTVVILKSLLSSIQPHFPYLWEGEQLGENICYGHVTSAFCDFLKLPRNWRGQEIS